MDPYTQLVLGLSSTAVVALVAWLWVIHNSLANLRVDIAKNYVSKPELIRIEASVDNVDKQVRSMLELLYSIKGQIEAWGVSDSNR